MEAVKVWQELAARADRPGLVRIARVVSIRKMNQVALDMLLARYNEFKLDSIYLGQLCTEAIALKKFPQAVGWATERVRLTEANGEIASALSQALQIIDGANASESVLQKLRQKNDRNAVETCLLVELLERSSLSDEAESVLQASLESSKAAKRNQDVQILAKQQVRLARGRRDWDSAASAARALLDLPGGRKSQNVKQLVELYSRANDNESALNWIAEWKRLAPGSLLPWLNEAALLDCDGKSSESIAVLRRAFQKFPDDSYLAGRLAQKYRRDGQSENARRILWRQYEQAEILSEKILLAEQLARVADDKNETDQLVKKFEKRRKSNPQSIEPLLSIAQVHRIAGNYEGRRAALIEATRLKKNDLPLLLEIASLEESEGDWEKAIQTLERASVLDKTNQSKQKIAAIYLEYGETKKGLAWLLEIAGGANSTADDIERISEAIIQTGDWEELLVFLEPNLARFPDNYRLGYLHAIANEELGNTDAAKRQFLRLLQADREVSPAPANLNQTSYMQNELSELEGTFPQRAISLLVFLSETPELAYRYRAIQPGGFRSTTSAMGLPTDLESCHEFALCHLCEIARDFSEDAKDKLQSQLERIGVEDSKLLMADGLDMILLDPIVLLDVDPDSEVALAVLMVMTIWEGGRLPETVYLKAFEAFKESYPGISFVAAIKLDQTKPENQARLAEAVKQLSTIDEPNESIFSLVAAFWGFEQELNERDLLEKHKGELDRLLQNWYPKVTQSLDAGWGLEVVAESYREEESPKRLIEFLDQELIRIKGQSKQPLVRILPSRFFNSEPEIWLPTYPPRSLISFPHEIYTLLEVSIPFDLDGSPDPIFSGAG